MSTGVPGPRPRLRLGVLVVAMAVLASSCVYFPAAFDHYQNGDLDTRPWWCESSGLGGHGSLPPHTGATKGQLSWSDCLTASAQFDVLNSNLEDYATESAGEAAGYYQIVGYAEGMGTHHAVQGALLPGILTSPGFDPDDPSFPGTPWDSTFDALNPEFLMYASGNLVGVAYWVKNVGGPPVGFNGDNDWWHQHPLVCLNTTTGAYMGEDRTDPDCGSIGGINVDFSDWYMAHAWVLPGWNTEFDVFAHHHPCLKAGGPETNPDDPCWMEAMMGGGH